MAHTHHSMTRIAKKGSQTETPVVLKGKIRGKIWEQACGMWKDRKPDPIKELNKMRKEMDRKFPEHRLDIP